MNGEHDIHRAEDEGMIFHEEHLVKTEDPELKLFLDSIIETFYNDSEIFDFRDALLSRLEKTGDEEKRQLVEIANRHFLGEKCPLHEKEIVVPNHWKVTYGLDEGNIVSFLANEGFENLKRHTRQIMPEEWANMLEAETVRLEEFMITERYNAGTPG